MKLVEKETPIGEVLHTTGNTNEITINDLANKIIKRCKSNSQLKYISYKKAYGSTGFEDMKRR